MNPRLLLASVGISIVPLLVSASSACGGQGSISLQQQVQYPQSVDGQPHTFLERKIWDSTDCKSHGVLTADINGAEKDGLCANNPFIVCENGKVIGIRLQDLTCEQTRKTDPGKCAHCRHNGYRCSADPKYYNGPVITPEEQKKDDLNDRCEVNDRSLHKLDRIEYCCTRDKAFDRSEWTDPVCALG